MIAVWDLLDALGRLAIAAVIIWKLTRFPHLFNACERWGLSIGAGAALMTVPAIWAPLAWVPAIRAPMIWAMPDRGPFGGWASTAFTWAMLVHFTGRLARHWRQERADAAAAGERR